MIGPRLLRFPDAYAGMPGGRKGHNVPPTRAQFRDLHRLIALMVEVSDALSCRIGHHLPVVFVDRMTRFTHWKTLSLIRSKLDTWACKVEPSHWATSVFYGDDEIRKRARDLVRSFLADSRESLPDGFMGDR